MDDPKARRGASRFVSGQPAVVRRDPDPPQPCEAENLSRSGALLIGALSVRAGDRIQLELTSPAGDLRFEGPATVIRVDEDPQGVVSRVAVEFERLDPRARETLEALIARVVEGMVPAALEMLPTAASPEKIRAALEKIPLAQRIVLATRASPREREILLQDPHPQVIDALARNPQLVPPEVRAILRLRVLLPATLETLARDPRWRGQESLRIQIAAHHNAPPSLSERIADGLSRDGVQRLVRLPSLNDSVRRKLLRKHALH